MSAPREGDALERLEKWLAASDVRCVDDISFFEGFYSVALRTPDGERLRGKGADAESLSAAIHAALDAAGAEEEKTDGAANGKQ